MVDVLPETQQPRLDWLFVGSPPAPETVGAFLACFARRVAPELNNDLARSLSATKPGVRFLAAVRLQMHLGYGVDTAAGSALGEALWPLLQTYWSETRQCLGEMAVQAAATSFGAWVYATKEEGQWPVLLKRLESAADWCPELPREPAYWNVACVVAITRLRNNDVATARAMLEAIPADLLERVPQAAVLRGQLTSFAEGRFELDIHPPTEEQAYAIWDRDLHINAKTLQRLHDQVQIDNLNVQGWNVAQLPALIKELQSQREYALGATPFDEKYRELARRTLAWREDLRQFLSPGYDPDHVNREWVEGCLARVALLQAGAYTPESLVVRSAEALRQLARAMRWARRAGDTHTLWMLRWSAVIVYDRTDDREHMSRALSRLCRSLHAGRLGSSDAELCSLVANFFSGLPEKVAELHRRQPSPWLMLEASELRRGRALLASRAQLQLGRAVPWRQPALLGPRTHYLGFTVMHDQRAIVASLLTADGRLVADRVEVEWTALQAALRSLDPSGPALRNPLAQVSPWWRTLVPLLGPLAQALADGRVADGDHLCLAAEDPIHLLPLHSLPCGGLPLFRRLTVSRVTSLGDALYLTTQAAQRPARAVAVFVDAQHRDPQLRRKHFGTTVAQLQALLPEVLAHEPTWITAEQLVNTLAPAVVVHLHAHGYFELGQNPHTNGGIVVSDGRGLPRLGRNVPLLTPKTLLDAAPQLTGSHVTLSACVSGQGLPGRGGDVMGLEMALRWQGAASVLATHWDIRSEDATIFCERFYRHWLGEGLSRGEAWQRTMLSLAHPTAPLAEQLRWSAFSLFGQWK
jgi:hypothetical protein